MGLPEGYTVKAKDEVTERDNRVLVAAMARVKLVLTRLEEMGYEPDKAKPAAIEPFYVRLSDEERNDLECFKEALVAALVLRDGKRMTVDEALDLPAGVFAVLAEEASGVYNEVAREGSEASPDDHKDPNPSTGASDD